MDKDNQAWRKKDGVNGTSNMVKTLMAGILGDMLYGHEGQLKKGKNPTIILVERHGPRH
jgi:hypothetical protein